MRKYSIFTVSILAIAFFSCEESKKEMEVKVAEQQMNPSQKFHVIVDNALDPVCEMATTDHLSDTIHYQGKVYGFCSKICKEEFEKNPENFINQED